MKEMIESARFEKREAIWDPLSESRPRAIWTALGSHIASQLSRGKAVMIPKFGLFTFGPQDFRLKGTTNPQLHDPQNREPVFVVDKKFVNGIMRSSGIVQDIQ